MKRFSVRTTAYLVLDILLLAGCVLRIPDLRTRARAPFDLLQSGDSLVVSAILVPENCRELREGDVVRTYAGQELRTEHDVEFITDFKSIGDQSLVGYVRDGIERQTTVLLAPYFTLLYIIMVFVVGLTTIAMAFYLVYNRPRDLTATILHWAFASLGVVVIVAWEGHTPRSILSSWNGVFFFVTYSGVATMFLLFTTMFPRLKFGPVWAKAMAICFPAVGVLIPLLWYHQDALANYSLVAYGLYQDWFDLFHATLVVYVVAGVLVFVHSYLVAVSQEERKKLKWILFGLSVGPLPFLLFTVLPITFAPRFIIPEYYTLAFLVAIPLSFAISVVRYHLLDIDVVINRATVYGVVIGVMLALYVIVIGIAVQYIGLYAQESSIIAAVAVALLFQPVRSRVQKIIDRRFFRVHYNFREAERRFVEDIKHCLDIGQLAKLVVEQTDQLIPVERMGFVVLQEPDDRFEVLAQKNFSTFSAGDGVVSDIGRIAIEFHLPVGLPDRLEPGVRFEPADKGLFLTSGLVAVFPMLSESLALLGFLALGEKKSGARFTLEDADLLNAVTVQAGLAIERLQLQTRLVLERAEAQRQVELNRLKSDFVSYVSHELRTPLTSIKMFAELLERRVRPADRKAKEYLRVIEGESDRLDRMVTTILDSARIEEGVKGYTLVPADLRAIADQVMTTMRYQLKIQQFRVVYRRGMRPLRIVADVDGVMDAIINLIGNSIKYSASRKYLAVLLGDSRGWITCSVQDRGVGISPGAIPHLFERFYRDPVSRGKVEGVGLGLPMVKHIMDVHGGRVEVVSTLWKGTTVVLKFPHALKEHPGERPAAVQTDSRRFHR